MFEIMNECERLNIQRIIEWLSGLKCKYLIVKHDKDTPRTPHYHVFVKMDNKRSIEDIAKMCDVSPQFIERVKSWTNALAYAFHYTDGARDDGKHIYNEDAIISACDVDYNAIKKTSDEYQSMREHDKQLDKLLYQYGECQISKAEMFKHMSAEDYNRKSLIFKRMAEYRIMKVRDRDMKVIYITGASGSGKTTLAKYMARMFNYDLFVSGSGKDVLDGYDKEECIILDDLRADVFTKAELFKLTDNNTNSSVKSRFKNKDISYCKLMIITSIKRPRDLYNWDMTTPEDKDETFKQFARRLEYKFLELEDNGNIIECNYEPDCSRIHRKLAPFTMFQVFSLLGIEKKLGSSLMNDIFKKISEDVKHNNEIYDDIIEEDNPTADNKNKDDLPF